MKDTNLLKQNDCYAAAFALADLCTQLGEQSLNVAPLDVRAGRVSEDQSQGALLLSLHASIVPQIGTDPFGPVETSLSGLADLLRCPVKHDVLLLCGLTFQLSGSL